MTPPSTAVPAFPLLPAPRHPSVLQLHTEVLLRERAAQLGRHATLDDVTDGVLDEAAQLGFDYVWWLGVWKTGAASLEAARAHVEAHRDDFTRVLPDLRPADVVASPFSVLSYEVRAELGGAAALARLRARMATRRLRLLLDFVPNHTALDAPEAAAHPEWFVLGDEAALAGDPHSYVLLPTASGPRVFAHGRDPYFPAWRDTLQCNYRHPGRRAAGRATLAHLAAMCDGVRCDMAMLLEPDVIARTWGERARPADGSEAVDAPFWPEAIAETRRIHPGFLFVAEVYWGLEARLHTHGFDYTYDKALTDELVAGNPLGVRTRLQRVGEADAYGAGSQVRFIENHDEPPAAIVLAPRARHQAAAAVALLLPGMRLMTEGQLVGHTVRVPMQLGRRPEEAPDRELQTFYRRLLAVARELRAWPATQWRLWEPGPAWPGGSSHEGFIVATWGLQTPPPRPGDPPPPSDQNDAPATGWLVAVNYTPERRQTRVPLPLPAFADRKVQLHDVLGSDARYERDGDEMHNAGLYLDEPPWAHLAFRVTVA